MLLYFTWWVNRKDAEGRNAFQGGFLGMDNIGVFDRSQPDLLDGHRLEQADGTAWMAMFCLDMLAIALELARTDLAYESMATKFFEHFIAIAQAHQRHRRPGRHVGRPRTSSTTTSSASRAGAPSPCGSAPCVGVIPLLAVLAIEPETWDRLERFRRRVEWYLRYRPTPDGQRLPADHTRRKDGHRLMTIADRAKLEGILARLLDPASSSPITASARSPGSTRPPLPVPWAACRLRAGRVDQPDLRRQLELARADLVPDQLPDHPGAPRIPSLLRRRLPGRAPHRLGPEGRPGTVAQRPVARLTRIFLRDESRRRPAARLRRQRRSSRPTRTGATTSRSTSTSTATTAPAWAQATRPAGRPWSRSCWNGAMGRRRRRAMSKRVKPGRVRRKDAPGMASARSLLTSGLRTHFENESRPIQ